MSIEMIFRSHIITATGATVYMNRATDDATYPYIVQRVISKTETEMGTGNARIQFDIFGDTYAEVKNIAVACNQAFKTFNVTDVFACYRGNELETYETEINKHRVILDALVRFEERPLFD